MNLNTGLMVLQYIAIKFNYKKSYCLSVKLGEDTHIVILREMLEKLDTNVSIDKKGSQTHESSFYYMITPENFIIK